MKFKKLFSLHWTCTSEQFLEGVFIEGKKLTFYNLSFSQSKLITVNKISLHVIKQIIKLTHGKIRVVTWQIY